MNRALQEIYSREQIGIALCSTLEEVLSQSAVMLEKIWQQLTADFFALSQSTGLAAADSERMSASLQYQDRHVQILQQSVAALAHYRALLARESRTPDFIAQVSVAREHFAMMEKTLRELANYQPIASDIDELF